jgi:N-carbamoylputrescine amidase
MPKRIMRSRSEFMRLLAAAIQIACTDDEADNLARIEALIRSAARRGATLIVTQELFEGRYFPQDADLADRSRARPLQGHPLVERFRYLARELGVVLPCSFYEAGPPGHRGYNSLAMIDAGGALLGVYRKSHIPFGPGYEEKHFFADGDSGPMAFDTAAGRIGAGICWDQWQPEFARVLALKGAEILIYPTAIGSEPASPGLDTRDHWRIVMQGHAGANLVSVIAANRIGVEPGKGVHDGKGRGQREGWAREIAFYGSSFITDHTGRIAAEADRIGPTVIMAEIDLAAAREARRNWGVFRDRRHDLFGLLTQPSDPSLIADGYRATDA